MERHMKQNIDTLTEVDFLTWDTRNLARLTAELYQSNKQLRAANEQLRLDLKDAMAQVRKTIKDQETIDELFDLHASARDGRLSKVDAHEFLKSVLS